MATRDFIKAEVAACNIATHGAQLANAVCDAKHASGGPSARGADVYFEYVRENIADIRHLLNEIEAGVLPPLEAAGSDQARVAA